MVSLSALKCILVSLIDKSPWNSTQHLVSGEYQCNLPAIYILNQSEVLKRFPSGRFIFGIVGCVSHFLFSLDFLPRKRRRNYKEMK